MSGITKITSDASIGPGSKLKMLNDQVSITPETRFRGSRSSKKQGAALNAFGGYQRKSLLPKAGAQATGAMNPGTTASDLRLMEAGLEKEHFCDLKIRY